MNLSVGLNQILSLSPTNNRLSCQVKTKIGGIILPKLLFVVELLASYVIHFYSSHIILSSSLQLGLVVVHVRWVAFVPIVGIENITRLILVDTRVVCRIILRLSCLRFFWKRRRLIFIVRLGLGGIRLFGLIFKMRVVRFRQQFDVGLPVESIRIRIPGIFMIILLLECLLLFFRVATDATAIKIVSYCLFLFLRLECFVLFNCKLPPLFFILMFFMLSHVK